MARQKPDESLGLDQLSQSQVEAVPSASASLMMEVELDAAMGDGSEAHSPQAVLRSLMADNGLVAVLEAFQVIMETQIERLQDSSMQTYTKQLSAFQTVAHDLAALIADLPPELDIELALTQLTRTAPAIEENSITLNEDIDQEML
jgi:hypothetical protein